MAKKNIGEKLVNIEDVADYTGLSVPYLWKAKAKYGLPHYKIGRLVKFRFSEVDVWLKQRQIAS